jgi:hypothetical protein
MSAKSRAAARSNSARSLWPASSSGASVGPVAVSDAEKSGGAFTARSTMTAPSLFRMTSRQNVLLSWIRSMLQPRPRDAASRASQAAGTCPVSGVVKKSRSSVGRVVRCCATRAAPPASRSPYSRAGRRTAWRPPSGKQSAPASRQPWPRPQDLLPPSRRGPAGGLDHRGPRRSDRSRKHQLIPEVEQQGAVNVGQDVGWTSFLEHDLVQTSTVGA